MTTDIAKKDEAEVLAKVMLNNDLSGFSNQERLSYVQQLTQHLGLNPFTQPLQFISFRDGTLSLYAAKNCTDQLRDIRKVSIEDVKIEESGEYCVVTVFGSLPDSKHPSGIRKDSDIGVVPLVAYGKPLQGEQRANAIMKAVTKAKRRFTLSICQLGFMDESEAVTVGGASLINMDYETGSLEPTGVIIEEPSYSAPSETTSQPDNQDLWCEEHGVAMTQNAKQKQYGLASHKISNTGDPKKDNCNGDTGNRNKPASSRAPAVKKEISLNQFYREVKAFRDEKNISQEQLQFGLRKDVADYFNEGETVDKLKEDYEWSNSSDGQD